MSKRKSWIDRAVSSLMSTGSSKDYSSGDFSIHSLGDIFSNLIRYYAHTGMTDDKREEMAEQDRYLDENREQDYEITKRGWEQMYSPEATIKSQAAGLDAVGLNRMALAGNVSSGASASTPSPSQPNASGSSGDAISALMSIIDTSLSYRLKNRQLDIDEGHLANETKRTDAEVEGIDIRNANLQELLDLQKGESGKRIEYLGQQIETEPVKRALLRTEIGFKQAQIAVQENYAALQKIDLKYHDAYQAAQLAIAKAYQGIAETDNKFHRKMLEQQIGINAKQIEIMEQTVITGKLEAGLLAKQFKYYDSDRTFNRWNTGIGTAAKAIGAVAGVAMGASSLGKAAGLFGNPLGNVPQGVVDAYNYRAAHPDKYK